MANDPVAAMFERMKARAAARAAAEAEKAKAETIQEPQPEQEVKPEPEVKPEVAVEATVQSNPFIVAPSQTLLSSGAESDVPEYTGDTMPGNATSLSDLDTTAIEPKDTPEKTENLRAAELDARSKLKSTDELRALCDSIDERIGERTELHGPDLVTLRSQLSRIMITLKSQPEFAPVLIDKDIRNVMRIVRAIRAEALAIREIKAIKKVDRQVKGAAKKKDLNESRLAKAFDSIAGMDFNFGPKP